LCTNNFDVTHALEHSYDLCAREPLGTPPPKKNGDRTSNSKVLSPFFRTSNRTGLRPVRLLLLKSPCLSIAFLICPQTPPFLRQTACRVGSGLFGVDRHPLCRCPKPSFKT